MADLPANAAEPLDGGTEAFPSPRRGGGGVTHRQLVTNLICAGLGTGMFSLPSSTAGSSVIPAVVMIAAMMLMNYWTILLLVRTAEAQQVFDLSALFGLLPGGGASRSPSAARKRAGLHLELVVNGVLWVACMLSLISYLMAMQNSLAQTSFLAHMLDSKRSIVIVGAAAAMVPLCFLDQKWLSFSSAVAVAVTMYIIALVLWNTFSAAVHHRLPRDICILGVGRGIPSMLAVLGQCVVIQMCVLPMYEEMEHRSTSNFRAALRTAFGVLFVILCAFAVLGYLAFGPGVGGAKGNLLLSLPKNAWGDCAQLGTVLVVAALYPIMVLPMVAPVKRALRSHSGRASGGAQAAATVGIVVLSCVSAIHLPSLLAVNIVGGALCVGVFASVIPGLAALRLLAWPRTRFKTVVRIVALLFVVVVGPINAVLGVVLGDTFVADIASSCMLRAT